ncbi:MAG: hypothetical protein A2Z97_03205 [Bdellovibrionales bacterium GWB1_52_6]|nr:MAG: hypothetical protein A2Z97_03205 [Bdellovibrionales bacterium GWB1_52_6]
MPIARVALKTVLPYTVFASLWIVFSDKALERLGLVAEQMTTFSIVKGLFFVLVTSLLLLILIRGQLRAIIYSEEQLNSIISHLPDAIVLISKAREVIHVNEAAKTLFEIDSTANANLEMTKFFFNYCTYSLTHPEGGPIESAERASERALNGEIIRNMPSVLHLPSGKTIHLSVSAAPASMQANQIQTVALAIRDVSELRRLEGLRDEFLSNAAHDLKTPLSVIKTNTQLFHRLGEKWDSTKRTALLESTDRQCDKLTTLIEELLDSAASSEGMLRLNRSSFDLARMIREVSANLGAIAYPVNISVESPDRLEVFADQQRIERVLTNLLQNAVKYSKDTGEITVCLRAVASQARIEVRDTGIGISETDKHRVFERYFQGNARAHRQLGGMGLGLHLSRQIIEAHGGKMNYTSQLGVGSTFYFTLPLGGSPDYDNNR